MQGDLRLRKYGVFCSPIAYFIVKLDALWWEWLQSLSIVPEKIDRGAAARYNESIKCIEEEIWKEVEAMKKIGIWTARVGLLGIFFWCSSLFATWLCYRHTPIEVQSGTMIWVAALIGLQILLYLSFSWTEKKQRTGWQLSLIHI